MQLRNAINNVFVQLNNILQELSSNQYSMKSKLLDNATVGQHVRHIIELFLCLQNGYLAGIVNYDKRERNQQIETDKVFAAHLLKEIYEQLDKADKPLLLEACYDDHENSSITIATNYYREIAYNLEHAVHHMAMIRVGVAEVSDIQLPQGFGVASSTIKYQKEATL